MEKLRQDLSRYDLFATESIQELTPLAKQGYCNQNYLLTTQKASYLVRVFGSEPRDRVLEYAIQSQAYERGISPEALYLDIENNLMVMAYSTGIHQKELTHLELKNLAKTLIMLHSIKIHTSQVTIDVDTSILKTFDYDPVLCHNDLNSQNILWQNDMPMLIDWEYAGTNDRYFDLACMIVEFELNASGSRTFMDTYFQGNPWDDKKLKAYITLYQKVCQHWWENK